MVPRGPINLSPVAMCPIFLVPRHGSCASLYGVEVEVDARERKMGCMAKAQACGLFYKQ